LAHIASGGLALWAVRSRLDLMPQISPYHFGLGIYYSAGSRLDGGERGKGAHLREARVPASSASSLSNSGVVAFPGASGGDSEVRLVAAST
jgi:hypothetical protein